MEAALLSGFLNTILTKLLSLAEDQYKLLHGMKRDMEFLEKELKMMLTVIHGKDSSRGDNIKRVRIISIEDLRELARRIEDCIDDLMYFAASERQASSLRRILGCPSRQHILRKFAEKLKCLVAMPAQEHDRSKRYDGYEDLDSNSTSGTFSCCQQDSSDQHTMGEADDDDPPMGIDAHLNELMEQLTQEAEGQVKKLKVISIVGIPGSGKTVLARALYNSEAGQQFGLRAWVSAAHRGVQEVLMEILRELSRSRALLDPREHLEKKRYLIVIDGMGTDHDWSTIASAFPRDDKHVSRIIVTTTVLSVAKASSLDNVNVHVHKIGRLDKKKSEELFVKKACLKIHSKYGHPDSEAFLKKCDGQALALVTVGQFLRKMGWPTEPSCNRVCRSFRHHLLENNDMERMRQVLIRSYSCLPSDAPKACLMYFGMFPSHHPIRRKRMMRLWLAEGYLGPQPLCGALDLAEDNFDTLIDHNIIEPVDVSNNSNVKTCRTYGMMREFISINSMSQGFIAYLGDEKLETKPSYVRRLSFYHSSTTDDRMLDDDLKLVRSLTITGKASEAILDFRKYRLLRVLDLEGCTADMGNNRLKDVCDLLLLKYLSLGHTVTSLPKEIKKLRLLETLDLRKCNEMILPMEVILLPNLIHLFGKFRFSDQDKIKKLEKLVSLLVQSSLETLAGFITGECQAFPKILCHMKNLSKVEIWCEGTTCSMSTPSQHRNGIQQFIYDKNKESSGARSLSLHFNGRKPYLLDGLEEKACYLTSLKLEGMLIKLPQFVLSLRELAELCLESSNELTTELLTKLGDLKYLKYLKLNAHHLEKFIIKKGQSFPKLLRMCLILKRPTLPSIIEDGALEHLVSLLVICEDLVGLSGMRIEYLHSLTDITLHPGVKPGTKEEWEMAANQHPGRPKILFLLKDDATASKHTDGSVISGPAKNVRTKFSDVSDELALKVETQVLLNQGARSSSSSRHGDRSPIPSNKVVPF